MNALNRRKSAKEKRIEYYEIGFFTVLVLFIANLNAIVDRYLHPEIPYFDNEHLIVGGITGGFSLILGVIIYLYLRRLNRISRERKHLLLELSEAMSKAEESERLKSAFLANMSHEIRTPLNGILGFASLLEGPTLTSDEQSEFLKIIQKSGDRMLNIINEIIDISKIESGTMEIRQVPVDINKKLDNVFQLFDRSAAQKEIRLYVEKSLSDKDSVISTDRDKLYSVLTNLVKNAIKYTNGGSVRFGYKLRSPSGSEFLEDDDNNVLEFFVKDTGIGIDFSRQRAVFDRFVQADIKDIEARQGAGLGLAITKAYVEMLGGIIWVESSPGDGSVFYFTIPYIKSEKKKPEPNKVNLPDQASLHLNNLKVLIVEDDKVSIDFVSRIFDKTKNTLLFAETGPEAVEICRKHPDVDLILMDIKIPDMDGYQATIEIRKFNKEVIIIAQTAYALVGDKEKALESGCNDYIAKPILKDDLLNLIQIHIKK